MVSKKKNIYIYDFSELMNKEWTQFGLKFGVIIY